MGHFDTPEYGYYVLELNDFDYSKILFDATIEPLSMKEVYQKIYGESLTYFGDGPSIRKARFIPYIWKNIF